MGQYRLPAELVGVMALVIAAYFYGGISYREQIAEMKQRVRIAEEKSQQVNRVIETKNQQVSRNYRKQTLDANDRSDT